MNPRMLLRSRSRTALSRTRLNPHKKSHTSFDTCRRHSRIRRRPRRKPHKSFDTIPRHNFAPQRPRAAVLVEEQLSRHRKETRAWKPEACRRASHILLRLTRDTKYLIRRAFGFSFTPRLSIYRKFLRLSRFQRRAVDNSSFLANSSDTTCSVIPASRSAGGRI